MTPRGAFDIPVPLGTKLPVTAGLSLLPLVAIGATCIALTIAGPWLHIELGPLAHWFTLIATAALAALAALTSDRLPIRKALLVIAVVAIAMRVSQILLTPYLSDDIYRYVWDGRVQAAGINPYRYLPAAVELTPLRDTAIYPLINRADYAPTIYPPVAQMFFFAVTRLGETVLVMKLGLLAFEALAIAATLAVLNRLRLPPTRIAAFAWHPLAVWEIAGSGHIDAGMVGLMMLGTAAFLSNRALLGGVLVAAAALMKPIALVILPAFWRPWDLRLPAIVITTLVASYVPYMAVGSRVFGYLPGYVQEEELGHGQGFRYLMIVQAMTGPIAHGALIYAGLAAIILGALALLIGFRKKLSDEQRIAGAAVLLTTFLVLLTPHYPWYYLALVPFLTVYPASATLWLLTVGGLQTYQTVEGNYLAPYDTRQIIFHSLVLAAIAWDLRSLGLQALTGRKAVAP
jgi:alpha-1,6-mannosyltransferase